MMVSLNDCVHPRLGDQGRRKQMTNHPNRSRSLKRALAIADAVLDDRGHEYEDSELQLAFDVLSKPQYVGHMAARQALWNTDRVVLAD